jgi:folate-dependent phosphoribosylglycinamide formyltransferase PurN
MKYKYAIYTSGNATRILNFYSSSANIKKFDVEFIYYDGGKKEIINKLNSCLGKHKIKVPKVELEEYKNFSNSKKRILLNEELSKLIIDFSVDYIFVFGIGILNESLLELRRNGFINFHPSLLPAFPGLNSIDRALDSNVKILGHTAHFITPKLDSGPIISQVAISRNDIKTLNGFLDIQLKMLKRIWNWLENDSFRIENQNVIILEKCKNKMIHGF